MKAPWTSAEEALVREARLAGMKHREVSEHLARHGFQRTTAAVTFRARRLGLSTVARAQMFGPTPFAASHRYPKRVTDALHELAESNPSPAEFDRRKTEIMGER